MPVGVSRALPEPVHSAAATATAMMPLTTVVVMTPRFSPRSAGRRSPARGSPGCGGPTRPPPFEHLRLHEHSFRGVRTDQPAHRPLLAPNELDDIARTRRRPRPGRAVPWGTRRWRRATQPRRTPTTTFGCGRHTRPPDARSAPRRVPDPQARRVASVKVPRFALPADSAEGREPNELQGHRPCPSPERASLRSQPRWTRAGRR
jgi:hypothetical protein